MRQLNWEARQSAQRFMRRYGVFSLLVGTAIALAVAACLFEWRQVRVMDESSARIRAATSAPRMRVDLGPDPQTRLKAFDAYLLSHAEVPDVVRDLIALAADEGLSLPRGEYRPLIEPQGGFLRYRMTIPVSGPAPSVLRFIESALRKHRALALESVEFKRERIDAVEVTARILWIVMARLPQQGSILVTAAPAVTQERVP
jgi:hypothetical protein